MRSEALRILDENTVNYMIKELERANEIKDKMLESKDKILAEYEEMLKSKNIIRQEQKKILESQEIIIVEQKKILQRKDKVQEEEEEFDRLEKLFNECDI